MSEREVDHLSISIDEMLSSLSHIPFKPYIFRVSDKVRSQNEKAYEPKMLAIGPYHHGKDKLQIMEGHKCRYLQQLLQRRNELSVNKYIVVLRGLEEVARQCYGESIGLNKDEFVKMMLFDGFFIIELFRKFAGVIKHHDTIFDLDQIGHDLLYDLVLFENQIPFFILAKLFDMTRDLNPPNQIIDLALFFLEMTLPGPITFRSPQGISLDKVDHLLGLIHSRWCQSNEMMPDRNEVVFKEVFVETSHEISEDKVCLQRCFNFLGKQKNKRYEDEVVFKEVFQETSHEISEDKVCLQRCFNFLGKKKNKRYEDEVFFKEVLEETSEISKDKVFLQRWFNFLKKKKTKRYEDEDWKCMKCTTELRDAGIKFKKSEYGTPLFDIKFKKGVLKIPLLKIYDETEIMFRNQIAYEQSRPFTYARVVTDYAYFMDSLINSAKDVEKLRYYGIIENLLGHDEAVSAMFNKLCSNVSISSASQNRYTKVFKEVNNHCRHRCNTWLAKLNRNYFNSPWRIISICAAVLLLLLTLVQTIFSVLSYFTQK